MSKKQSKLNLGCVLTNIDLDLVEEGERFRTDYGDIEDLKFSIAEAGLINPISVMPMDDGGYLLIAGGRRLSAYRMLAEEDPDKYKQIPVNVFPEELDELGLRILELAENTQRKEMNWQETNSLTREIHRLRQLQHGLPKKVDGEYVGWSQDDTAKMLGLSPSRVSESIKLADRMEKYSEIYDFNNCKTENDARKAVQRIDENLVRAELARRADRLSGETNFRESLISQYMIGDALVGMAHCDPEIFDLAIVDPPYAVDLNEQKMGMDNRNYNEWDRDMFYALTRETLENTYRLLKPDTFCIFWFGMEWFADVYRMAIDVGFTGNKLPAVWIKRGGQSNNPNMVLANAYEPFLILRKGSPVLANAGRINVFDHQVVAPNTKYHPTQKPVELSRDIVKTFSFENSKVLIPYLGSGVDIIACALERRKGTGWDLTEEYKGGFIQEVEKTFGKE